MHLLLALMLGQLPWAEIQVVDAQTGRGVPLVELETVNHLRFVTDNAGRVAVQEPGLMGREIFFHLRSHGYSAKKDGFGFAGRRVTLEPGKRVEIRITRVNLAERLCRLTGEGLYRDTALLGKPLPFANAQNPGLVAGQDSVQAAIYRDQVFWLWGDTLRMNYPLGLFRVAGAVTPIPDKDFDPAPGIDFRYFVDKSGFTRAMMPLPERPQGVVWIFGLSAVADDKGRSRLVGHYSRRKGLVDELEHGVAIFNDDRAVFEVARQRAAGEKWRFPKGHPILHEEADAKWLLFGSPNPNVRTPATLEGVLDPGQYEAFTCAKEVRPTEPDLDDAGKPRWRWQKELPPTDSAMEHRWIKTGKLKPDHARFCPVSVAAPNQRIVLHSGSVRWNAQRGCWILVAGQHVGVKSLLGEVWYAEASHPTGPFARAIQIATHERQSFYNVCHHAFFDRGPFIHFEGTYTNEFSGNPDRTPRYNYNQILYRLNLDAPELKAVREGS